jgi:hypothetical protein
VGIGKASVSEPLMTRRDQKAASKPEQPSSSGTEPGGSPSTGQVVPGVKAARARSAASAWNVGRRTPELPEDLPVRGSVPGGRNREALSTVAVFAGGPAGSSDETPVMGAERSSRVIWGLSAWSTGGFPG